MTIDITGDTENNGIFINFIFSSKIIASTDGNLQTVGANLQTGGNGSVMVAIYSDINDTAGSLLAYSMSTKSIVNWNDLSVTGISIIAGTKYWLAVQGSNINDIIYYQTSVGTGSAAYYSQSYTNFPTIPFWVQNLSIQVNMRMTYIPNAPSVLHSLQYSLWQK